MSWQDQLGWRGLHWPSARQVAESLRYGVTHNPGLKLLSLLAALAIWVFVNAGERDMEASLPVPLELRNIPPNLMIVSPRIDFIDLRVSGPRTLLGRIDRDRLAISLDLAGVRPGPAVFRVLPDQLPMPRGVNVVRLTPSEVTLELAQVARKRVPVHVALSGKPPRGLRVTEIKVSPEMVEAMGPADDVARLKVAETAPIDLADAVPGLIERDLTLEAPREFVSFSAGIVHVELRLEEPEETRVLRGIPVVVRNSTHRTTLNPSTVELTLRGPKSALDALVLEHGAVYIDAADREPGEYTVSAAVDLPADVELISQNPETLRLRVTRERRRTSNR